MSEPFAPPEQQCPSCQQQIPVNPGFITWCDRCGWNIDPKPSESIRSPFERLHISWGNQQSRMILDEFIRLGYARPKFGLSRLGALVIAGFLHSMAICMIGVGLWLLVGGWNQPWKMIAGSLCLLALWASRPQRTLEGGIILERRDAPVLYQLVDDISDLAGARRLHEISLSGRFNAGYEQVGWRGRRRITVGLPLWMILSSQERVALLAHEIAHAVNGDAQRGKFVGGAIEMLLRWYRLLHPVDLPNLDKSWLQILWTPLNLLRFFLSGLVGLAGYTLHWLLWRDQQRAEYYADYLAAGIVGTPAILSLLDKLHYEQVFVMALHGLALQGMTERTLFADLRQRAGQLPARELERIKRLQLTGLARLDRTHPPTIYRIEMLKTLESRMPVIVMNQEQSLAVDAELKPACDNIQKQLTEQYFRGLYQGYI